MAFIPLKVSDAGALVSGQDQIRSLVLRASAGIRFANMAQTGQHALPLIMMRELADNLATPLFLVDASGTLVYYNEAAEQILGLRYADAGSLTAEQWSSRWVLEELDGSTMDLEERPLSSAMHKQRPAHRPAVLVGLDGVRRPIEVTAFPLVARADEVVGAVAIFWDRNEGAS